MKNLLSPWFSSLILSFILVSIVFFGFICQPWEDRCTGGGCHHYGINPFTGEDFCEPGVFLSGILAVFLILVLFKILLSGIHPPEKKPLPDQF